MRIAWLVLSVVLLASCQFLEPTKVKSPTDDPVKVAQRAEAEARTDVVVDRLTKIERGVAETAQGIAETAQGVDQMSSDIAEVRADIRYLDEAVIALQPTKAKAGPPLDKADTGGRWSNAIVWILILMACAGVMVWRRWKN